MMDQIAITPVKNCLDHGPNFFIDILVVSSSHTTLKAFMEDELQHLVP